MDQATAGLVGAAIGAGGAVTGQIISATFTQRAASRRFEWERAQVRDSRFIDVKRELFALYLASHSTFRDTHIAGFPVTAQRQEELVAAWTQHSTTARGIAEEIALIAPEVEDACMAVMRAGTDAFSTSLRSTSTNDWVPGLVAYTEAISECRGQFSAHLDHRL